MTTRSTTTAPAVRIFRYGQHEIPDPGPQFTSEQVRQQLTGYFPELAQCQTEERPLDDGRIEITFRKQVTTKGAEGDNADIARQTEFPYEAFTCRLKKSPHVNPQRPQ